MGYLLGSRPLWCEFQNQGLGDSSSFHFLWRRQGQYVDGLRAPLLIHPPTEVSSYDEEFTVVLGDWYHDEHSVLLKQFINIANPGGAEPIPGRYFNN